MENRFLCRGKRIDTGKWVEGHLITDETDDSKCFIGYVIGTDEDGAPHDLDVVQVDSSTICRCTGLKDKNGKLIWENDIVKYRVYQHTEQLYKVIYDYEEGSWSLGCNSEPLYSIGRANSEKCEVVGNAFDNPELLEV